MMTIPEITGDNTVLAVVLPAPARWVRFTLIGTGTARISDSSTSSTVGEPLVASATVLKLNRHNHAITLCQQSTWCWRRWQNDSTSDDANALVSPW